MSIDQAALGQRLKQAREACALTQDEAARHLGLARATVAHIELGLRSVSGLELARFAHLYARDLHDFVAPAFTVDSLAFFRSDDDAEDTLKAALRDCIALAHQLRHLETLLGIKGQTGHVAAYPSVPLASKWEAIQSGTQAALEERRRLGLGAAPLGDLPALLESQGIRTGLLPLPDGISGLMMADPNSGLFVVVNRNHPAPRQRFSWCHEYAHVLLDRGRAGHVSRESERADLLEVRANVFAANFLMPEDGVRQLVGQLGKGSLSRLHAEIFDEAGVVPVDTRTAGGSQDLQLYDVVKLAHHFGVSAQSALYRLLNLKLVTEKQFQEMKQLDRLGVSREISDLLGFAEASSQSATAFDRRYLTLALEAYRREKISHRKLVEIAEKLHVPAEELDPILDRLGLQPEPATALLPTS